MLDRTNITDTHAPKQGYSTTTLVSDHDRGSLAFYTPCPTVTALDPDLVWVSGEPVVITVTGLNFLAKAIVYADGEALPTTFVSSTELTTTFDPPDDTGVVAFTVANGTVDSDPFSLTVENIP